MKKLRVFIFIIIFFLFLVDGMLSLDPDFGWHMKMGELMRTQGIIYVDPFSYTMPSYPVISHEWLVDLFFVQSFPFVGQLGLVILFSFFAFGVFFLQIIFLKSKDKRFSFVPLFLSLISLLSFFGIRPQILTWLFFSFLLVILKDYKKFKRVSFLLPFFFVLWANVHGGFALGIVALFVALGVFVFQKRISFGLAFLISFCCVFATCLTPYSWRMWLEIWASMSDGTLRWYISEWSPIYAMHNLAFWAFVIISVLLFIRYWKKTPLFERILYCGLGIAMIGSLRHIPLWLLVALPITSSHLGYLFGEASVIKYGKQRFLLSMKILVIISFVLSLQYFIEFASISKIIKQESPMTKVLLYLREHPSPGHIFSSYGLGGYLIWQYPEQKVFIDGRMPSWRGDVSVSKKESTYAFGDYLALLSNDASFLFLTDKFSIDTLVLPNLVYEKGVTVEIHRWMNQTLHTPLAESFLIYQTIIRAKQAGWKVVYSDDQFIILRRFL